MSDDLRTRIAKALQGESDDGFTWEDWLCLTDAVIRELGWKRQFGLQFDKYPTDVAMGRETNPDGTVTQVFEMNETRARQALDSPAPIGGINKHVVSRYVTNWERFDG